MTALAAEIKSAQTDQLLCHPFIVPELACGTPPSPRERTLGDLRLLQTCALATRDETMGLIAARKLYTSPCDESPAEVIFMAEHWFFDGDNRVQKIAAKVTVPIRPQADGS